MPLASLSTPGSSPISTGLLPLRFPRLFSPARARPDGRAEQVSERPTAAAVLARLSGSYLHLLLLPLSPERGGQRVLHAAVRPRGAGCWCVRWAARLQRGDGRHESAPARQTRASPRAPAAACDQRARHAILPVYGMCLLWSIVSCCCLVCAAGGRQFGWADLLRITNSGRVSHADGPV
jgi:hypothetical protein